MSPENITCLEKELKQKIQYLYQALNECMEIVDSLKKENEILTEVRNATQKICQD